MRPPMDSSNKNRKLCEWVVTQTHEAETRKCRIDGIWFLATIGRTLEARETVERLSTPLPHGREGAARHNRGAPRPRAEGPRRAQQRGITSDRTVARRTRSGTPHDATPGRQRAGKSSRPSAGDTDRMEANMPDRDDLRMFLGVGAVVMTLGVGTCSTNSRIDDINRRIDDGFGNVNRRIDDTNRRIDDTNRRIDDMQTDIRELRTLIFEALKSEQAPAN